jgi:hypothetical protein
VAALLYGMPARAAAPTAHLLYVREAGAEACPDEAALRAEVAQRLRREPFSEHALTTVTVIWSGKGRELRARIELNDASGELTGDRELTSRRPDCVELSRAVALAVSLAIDPLSFADQPTPPAAPPTELSPQTAPSPAKVAAGVPARLKTEAPAPSRMLRGRLGVGALAALGAAPGVSFGLTLLGGVRGPRWSANVEVRTDFPSGTSAAGGTVDTALYTATAIPCFHQGIFAGCALLQLGGQVSRGHGFPVSNDATTFYAAGGVRAALEIPIARRFEMQVRTDLLATFTRTTLYADQIAVFHSPPVSGAFHLAGLVHFP